MLGIFKILSSTRFFRIAPKFSVAFKSGDEPGHWLLSKKSMLLLFKSCWVAIALKHGALSWRNVTSSTLRTLFSFFKKGITCFTRTLKTIISEELIKIKEEPEIFANLLKSYPASLDAVRKKPWWSYWLLVRIDLMYGINFYFNIIYNNIFVFFLVLLDWALGGVNIFVIHPVDIAVSYSFILHFFLHPMKNLFIFSIFIIECILHLPDETQ